MIAKVIITVLSISLALLVASRYSSDRFPLSTPPKSDSEGNLQRYQFPLDKISATFKKMSSGNFTLYGDIKEDRIVELLRFFNSFSRYLEGEYELSVAGPIGVVIFKNPADLQLYRNLCDSDFGCYLYNDRLIISRDDAGWGTFAHELTHAFVHDSIKDPPAWFIEGFPTFFEKIFGYYENDELKLFVGFQNPWRVADFSKETDSAGKYPALFTVVKHSSSKNAERLLSLFLYKKGVLDSYVRAVLESSQADNSGKILLKIMGQSEGEIEGEWGSWIKGLVAEIDKQNSFLRDIPVSSILPDEKSWRQWKGLNGRFAANL